MDCAAALRTGTDGAHATPLPDLLLAEYRKLTDVAMGLRRSFSSASGEIGRPVIGRMKVTSEGVCHLDIGYGIVEYAGFLERLRENRAEAEPSLLLKALGQGRRFADWWTGRDEHGAETLAVRYPGIGTQKAVLREYGAGGSERVAHFYLPEVLGCIGAVETAEVTNHNHPRPGGNEWSMTFYRGRQVPGFMSLIFGPYE